MPACRSRASLSLLVGHRDVSDAELLSGLVANEMWAVAEVWHRFAPMVMMLSERCLGSRAEAEDICQEVFYRVFRKASTLRDPSCLRSFVYSFAVRAVKNALRYRKLRGWLSFEEPEGLTDLSWRTMDVESRDRLRRFHALLDRLAARDRLVFVLRRMESMTVSEIAVHLEISESTVKRSLSHATERLTHWIAADPSLADLADEAKEEG